ncbi:Hydrogenase maturation factor [Lachnospiraceae bacterium RM5]|nr:Hydrogenase maturation factor [Lachnospiraceae bacterium RM5]
MKTGRITDTILDRSVFKNIRKSKDKKNTYFGIGRDAAVINKKFNYVVSANATLGDYGIKNQIFFEIKRAIYSAYTNVYAECGIPKYLSMNIYLPVKTLENELKSIVTYIDEVANDLNLCITGGNTRVSANVNNILIDFNVIGDFVYDEILSYKDIIEEDMDIVLTGKIALSGTYLIVKEKYDELRKRYSKSYLDEVLEVENVLDVSIEMKEAFDRNVRIFHDVSKGGIYAALSRISKALNKGVICDLDKIPMMQQSVEVTEFFSLNPYKLLSDGAMLMVTKDGNDLCRAINEKNREAIVIGKIKNDNEKVFIKNGEKHYIEPPKYDEILNVFEV